MGRIRNTIYLDRDVDVALRDWAYRKGYSMAGATNILLRHVLFDSVDEGTKAMLVPQISRRCAMRLSGRFRRAWLGCWGHRPIASSGRW